MSLCLLMPSVLCIDGFGELGELGELGHLQIYLLLNLLFTVTHVDVNIVKAMSD